MTKIQSIISDLNKLKNKKRAEGSMRYFKTGKGQYGFGDVFLGLSVPEQRNISKKYKDLPLPDLQKLLDSKIHEHRFTALRILVKQFENSSEKIKEKIAKFYLKNSKRINNWDLVDTSAHYILGKHLLNKNRKILYKLVKSKNLWEKRISIISTFAFIRENDFEDALKISKALLSDSHDLIHKAVGWMLREVGKKSEKVLEDFLDEYAKVMPRTTLRYAIERFNPEKRKKYLNK